MSSIFNTVNTVNGRVERILNFLNSAEEFYVGLGKHSPWNSTYGENISDINPPFPGESLLFIPEPIIYKRIDLAAPATRASVCLDELENDFEINSSANPKILHQESFAEKNFIFHDKAQIKQVEGNYNVLPELIYLQTTIKSTDYLKSGWRASALFTKLYLNEEVPLEQDLYTPDQVKTGLIHQITFNSFIPREVDKDHRFEYLIVV